MPTPRSKLVSLETTNYYHCVSRCVRRAFLCGTDKLTNKSYEHRRAWVEQRLLYLASVFCIDVCAYAIMMNHCHLVLRIDDNKVNKLSDREVAKRWHKVCKGTLLTQEFVRSKVVEEHLQGTLKSTLEIYRQRLMDLSWFMRMLNEPIARMANQEDECTGRFWEGRFSSQALLDESAVIACMAYVDLNPVRAGDAATPERSKFTSVQKRVVAAKTANQPKNLFPFTGNMKSSEPKGLNFKLEDYLSLLDASGRMIRSDKIGYIQNDLPDILTRLSISAQNWLILTTQFEQNFQGMVGSSQSLDDLHEKGRISKRRNLTISKKLFG